MTPQFEAYDCLLFTLVVMLFQPSSEERSYRPSLVVWLAYGFLIAVMVYTIVRVGVFTEGRRVSGELV